MATFMERAAHSVTVFSFCKIFCHFPNTYTAQDINLSSELLILTSAVSNIGNYIKFLSGTQSDRFYWKGNISSGRILYIFTDNEQDRKLSDKWFDVFFYMMMNVL